MKNATSSNCNAGLGEEVRKMGRKDDQKELVLQIAGMPYHLLVLRRPCSWLSFYRDLNTPEQEQLSFCHPILQWTDDLVHLGIFSGHSALNWSLSFIYSTIFRPLCLNLNIRLTNRVRSISFRGNNANR